MNLAKLALMITGLILAGSASAIAGGKPVQSGSSPWMAALIDTSMTPSAGCTESGGSTSFCRHFCGATLIAPSWLVTAAHCMSNRNLESVRVLVGVEDLNTAQATSNLLPIEAIHYHPQAPLGERNVYRNDIALLQLASPLGNTTASIAMPDLVDILLTRSDETEDEVAVLGWGRLGESGGYPSNLQRVALDLMPRYCASQYAGLSGGGWSPEIWLCAGEPSAVEVESDDWRDVSPRDPGGEDACVLDSGGPLIAPGAGPVAILGIVSWGQTGDCGNPIYPTVYTRLPAYTSWIESVTAQNTQPLSDLSLTLTAPASAAPGSTQPVLVRLANQSSANAIQAVGFDITHNGDAMTLQSSSGLLCNATANGFHCAHTLAALNPGSAVDATFAVQSTTESVVTLAATSFRETGLQDYRGGNDNAGAAIAFSDKPDLRVHIDAVPTEIEGAAGNAWVYLTARNASSRTAATNVQLRVQLPAGHELVESGTLGCSGTGTLTCSLGTLPAGYSNSWRLALRAITHVDGVVTASITGANGDFPTLLEGLSDTSMSLQVVYKEDMSPNAPPTVAVCCAQVATYGDVVALEGSYDDDNQVTDVQWEQISGTPSVLLDTVTHSDTRSTASFNAPWVASARNLVFRLTVRDLQGETVSANVTVSLQPPAGNVPPIASAGANRSIASGEVVELDGTGTDVDGTIASMLWTQVGGVPPLTLYSPSGQTFFLAPDVDVATNLFFRLTVTDNAGATGTSDIVLTVLPPPAGDVLPVVDAGTGRSGFSGRTISLSGTASDGDGNLAEVQWRQLSGPAVTLADASAKSTTFTAPVVSAATNLVFALTVRDNAGAYVTDTVTVTIKPAGGSGGGGSLGGIALMVLALLGLRARGSRTAWRA